MTDQIASSEGLMVNSPSEYIDLYRRYGFTRILENESDILGFQFRAGGYFNADLVPLAPSNRVAVLQKQLAQSGYSCRLRTGVTAAELDRQLFLEFFNVESTRARSKAVYRDYRDKTSRATGVAYQYKPVRYTIAGSPEVHKGDLLERVADVIAQPHAKLILLEAAAGFGKTCTAYELLQTLARSQQVLPFFAELARNRAARRFRYVLLDELDRQFPGIPSALANYQIHKGRLLLILDGFDELIFTPEARAGGFEVAEPMLNTLKEYLIGDAAVVLTTRKTTLLAGNEFQDWLDKNQDYFAAHRFLLDRPEAGDWLDDSRIKDLKAAGFSLASLANPVLYAFLSSLDDQEFGSCCADTERIVGGYFGAMLTRERNRQDLRMSVIEQKQIFAELAREMTAHDFKAERREYLEAFLRRRFSDLLAQVCSRYPPSEEGDALEVTELVNKILLHAFLDRRAEGSDLVGFVNDFILGSLVGDNVVMDNEKEWLGPEDFVDLAATAYSVRSDERRRELWRLLQPIGEILAPRILVQVDLDLLGRVEHSLVGASYSDMVFSDLDLGRSCLVADSCFVNCRFERVNFYSAGVTNASFVNCAFYGCTAEGSGGPIYEFDCVAKPKAFLRKFAVATTPVERSEERADGINEFERSVLERFWPPGRPNFGIMRRIRTLYMGVGNQRHSEISEAIKALQRRRLISVVGDRARLNVDEIGQIMDLLGRA